MTQFYDIRIVRFIRLTGVPAIARLKEHDSSPDRVFFMFFLCPLLQGS